MAKDDKMYNIDRIMNQIEELGEAVGEADAFAVHREANADDVSADTLEGMQRSLLLLARDAATAAAKLYSPIRLKRAFPPMVKGEGIIAKGKGKKQDGDCG